jgi:hypothetical protein
MLLVVVRYLLPALVVLAGVLLFALDPSADTAEDAARDYFDRHGHWPDDDVG